MKFTNTIRNAFVRSVMGDVPSVDYEEAIRSKAMVVALSMLPPAVAKLWDCQSLRTWCPTS